MSFDSQIIAGRETEPFDSAKASSDTYLPHALLDISTSKLTNAQIPDLADILGDSIIPAANLPPTTVQGEFDYVYNFAYGDATPAVLNTVAVGDMVTEILVCITTAFNGTGASLAVGYSGSPTILMDTIENDPATLGEYSTTPAWLVATQKQLTLTITAGAGATAGAGKIIIRKV